MKAVMSRVISMASEDFIAFDDGFYYFWPAGSKGAFAAHELRLIADELDRRNKSWQEQINNYFDQRAADPAAESCD